MMPILFHIFIRNRVAKSVKSDELQTRTVAV